MRQRLATLVIDFLYRDDEPESFTEREAIKRAAAWTDLESAQRRARLARLVEQRAS